MADPATITLAVKAAIAAATDKRTWNDWQNQILKTYTNKLPPRPPLSQQKQFKSIKNMVIAEALKLGGHHFSFEDEAALEPELPEPVDGEPDDIFMSRLNAFLDSEMEQILCFDSSLDTETFCKEKCAIFIVLPEEDNTKYFMCLSTRTSRTGLLRINI